MTILDLIPSGPSNSIRCDHHPVLEPGSRAFPNGRYHLKFEQIRPSDSGSLDMLIFDLEHKIEQAQFITRLVGEGRADFACIVSSPQSSYRRIYRSRDSRQRIECDRANLGEPPLFTPLVVCTDQIVWTLDTDTDGVDPIWHGQTITLNRGSRLAVGNIVRLETSMARLLKLHADKDLEPGQFYVEEQTEPYQFNVKLHPKLHRFLRYKSGQRAERNNIIVHIVTACLALLQREWREGDDKKDWESIPNLKAFAAHLEDLNIPLWTDEEFVPEQAATKLYPLEFADPDSESTME